MKKKKNIYNERLQAFAEHLSLIDEHEEHGLIRTIIIYHLAETARIHIELKTQNYIFSELVSAFPEEWGFHPQSGEPILESEMNNISANSADCFVQYFSLTAEEMLFMLDIEGMHYQKKDKLTPDSRPKDFARNIFEVIKQRKNQSHGNI